MNWVKGVGLGVIFAVVAVVVALAIGLMAVFGVGLFQRKTAHFRGGTQATEIVQKGPHQVAAYNQFFDLCAGVQSLEEKAKLYADDQTAQNGVLGQRADLVTQYNANARKWTEGQFRSDDLPYQLDLSYDPKGPGTSCTA